VQAGNTTRFAHGEAGSLTVTDVPGDEAPGSMLLCLSRLLSFRFFGGDRYRATSGNFVIVDT